MLQETSQLNAIRERIREQEEVEKSQSDAKDKPCFERDFEGGFGGQEDLEDRYATTSGEH